MSASEPHRMRLAFVTSLLPTALPDTGSAIANACIVGALEQAGCEVRQFGFLKADETAAPPPNAVVLARTGIDRERASLLTRTSWIRDSLRLGLPVKAARLAIADAGALREAMSREGPFDACVINGAQVAAAFPWLLQEWPALLVAHDIGHRAAAAHARQAGFLRGVVHRRDASLIRASERKAMLAARFVWCLADEDRAGFGVDIADKSAALPLIGLRRPRLEEPANEASTDVGLIGTWTCERNLAGLRWFLDDVVPRLPGDVTIAIAGRLPSGFRSADPRITLSGRVPDAAAFIASCRCSALTSRTDTGIQLKAIEVFQLGMPAVATRASVRGIGWLPTNCLVADDAPGFAAALTKLVRDVRSERTIPGDGRVFAEAQMRGLRNGIAVGLAALRGTGTV